MIFFSYIEYIIKKLLSNLYIEDRAVAMFVLFRFLYDHRFFP